MRNAQGYFVHRYRRAAEIKNFAPESRRSNAPALLGRRETLALLDHFNAGGVAATQELVALLEPQTGETILDIGSGIGGPAPWIAARHRCTVTGVDITAAVCDAARELNAACGMTNRVRISRAVRPRCRCQPQALTGPTPTAS